MKKYEIKRTCKHPRFIIIITIQGQSFYYLYHNLIIALIAYRKKYVKRKKFQTSNISLRQVLITDDFREA